MAKKKKRTLKKKYTPKKHISKKKQASKKKLKPSYSPKPTRAISRTALRLAAAVSPSPDPITSSPKK
jgi:hypothetical protein